MTPETVDGLLLLLVVPIFGLALIAADLIHIFYVKASQYMRIKNLKKSLENER